MNMSEKAILVIDMPDCCAECPLMMWDAESTWFKMCMPTLKEENSVSDTYEECEDLSIRPSWCPLKPMPPKRYEPPIEEKEEFDFANWIDYGWNECLKEIEK